VSSVIEQTDQITRVCYYLRDEEVVEFQKMADYLYQERAIARPSVGAFAKAAGYYWLLKKEQQNATH
jgi:hypothetical protein